MLKTQQNGQLIKYAALLILVLLTLIGLTWVNYRFSVKYPGGNDFLARWNGAHEWLIHGNNPYTDQVSESAQKMIYGRLADPSKGEDIAHFVYPLYSMIFFAPFALVDYTLARALWMTLLELVLIALTLIGLRLTDLKLRPIGLIGILVFSLLWYCAIRTIILGQFSGINAFFIILAILFIKNSKDKLAGVMLALSTSKPQMSYLLIIFIVIWAIRSSRHWIWISLVITMAILIGGGWVFLPGWPIDWLRQMLNYPGYTDRIGSIVSILGSITPGIQDRLTLGLLVAFYGYMVFEWLRTRGNDIPAFLWTAYVTLVITNFVAYRTATPHYVALIPPLLLITKVLVDRWGKAGKWLNAIIYLLFSFGLWALFLVTLKGNEEQAVMYLPVPIILLIGLWWIRWWAVRPPTRLIQPFE